MPNVNRRNLLLGAAAISTAAAVVTVAAHAHAAPTSLEEAIAACQLAEETYGVYVARENAIANELDDKLFPKWTPPGGLSSIWSHRPNPFRSSADLEAEIARKREQVDQSWASSMMDRAGYNRWMANLATAENEGVASLREQEAFIESSGYHEASRLADNAVAVWSAAFNTLVRHLQNDGRSESQGRVSHSRLRTIGHACRRRRVRYLSGVLLRGGMTMGEVIAFRPKPPPVGELDELIAWLKPAADWRTGRMQIELAHHFRMMTDWRRMLAADAHGRESPEATAERDLADEAFKAWQIECLKQMFIPAECVRHLRWKQEWLRRNGGGSPETALAIARDEAAFAGRIELHSRQQATRKANRLAVPS
ncbi:hypothetical protein B5V02_22400 [Mesorhizobium kowhaii]|uniref:DUF4034 domain-containing protein n=2 Tax=Mesorhizobium kowhaii TaxID=1300272 RepID=A0A2W7BZD8_9HYPH|nr:hypothetical protein B5V02_22400 [Mesorhizobium kowhaii]